MSAATPGVEPPTSRLIVLGASNVHLGLPTIVGTVHAIAGRPVEVMAALGHGRSFGRASSIPGRTLPAILECRLWEDLAERGTQQPATKNYSLITDIGNDLLYGRSPRVVIDWVATCLDRLAEHGPVALAALPAANLETLGVWRYRAFRTLFFPGIRLSLVELSAVVRELSDRVAELAEQRGCALVPQPPAWYGIDPIHYRRRFVGDAWFALLSAAFEKHQRDNATRDKQTRRVSRIAFDERLRLFASAAAERKLLGVQRTCKQPCVTLRNGASVSLY